MNISLWKVQEEGRPKGHQDPRHNKVGGYLAYLFGPYILNLEIKNVASQKCQWAQTNKAPMKKNPYLFCKKKNQPQNKQKTKNNTPPKNKNNNNNKTRKRGK